MEKLADSHISEKFKGLQDRMDVVENQVMDYINRWHKYTEE